MSEASNPFNDFVFLNATPSDQGSFTLATEKALAKLEKFQLPDPTFFVLQWVQALVAAQAKRIDVSFTTTNLQGRFELEFTFDGPGYTRIEVDTLYDHVFRSGRDRSVDRLRELALGWLSACSLPITEMVLDSNGRQRTRVGSGAKMQESCQSKAALAPSEDDTATTPFHRLRIQGKGTYPFDEIIKRRCNEVTCELYLNGNLVSIADGGGGVPWPNRSFTNGPTRGAMGGTYGGSAASHLSFLRYGVEFVNRSEPSLLPPIILRVADDTLSKNVSQTDVVKDEAYDEFLSRIRSEMKNMGLQLTTKRIPGYQRDSLNTFIQAYLVNYIDVRVFDDPERLKLMGEEFTNLINFPLFKTTGNKYASLTGLREEYLKKGYLLYSLDSRAQLTRWDGVLLVIEPEEVGVLQKYFPNLTALSFDEVRVLCKGGMQQKLLQAGRQVEVCSVRIRLNEADQDSPYLNIIVPDAYPTGQTLLVKRGEHFGTTLPGLNLTLLVETSSHGLSINDQARLKRVLKQPILQLLKKLCLKLMSPDIGRNQSRMRYAELACELIDYVLQAARRGEAGQSGLEALDPAVLNAPIIGLEDGNLVSVKDLNTYLKEVDSVYLGGAFVEGLESGALDPMPRAGKLLAHLLLSRQIVSTETVRDRLKDDAELKYEFRRQTLIQGLGQNPNPAQALKNFASEAAAQAELVAQMEQEYKAALKGPKLFIKPDDARLQELAEETAQDDFVPFGLGEAAEPAPLENASTRLSDSPTVFLKAPPIPSLEQDLDELRVKLGDFCSTPGAVHTERREELYSVHLSTRWQGATADTVQLLRGQDRETLSCPIALEGFIRVCPTYDVDPAGLLQEAVEQLVIKTLHTFKAEAREARQRQRLREWLLNCCGQLSLWSKSNRAIINDLTELPLVPCLGERALSWRQLKVQAEKLGKTLVVDPHSREQMPDHLYDVIAFQAEWREESLSLLEFPPAVVWQPAKRKDDFDALIRNAWREMSTVISGHEEDLISVDVIGKLSGKSSFWTKWRLGFLSWDQEQSRALINPEHKLGKKLMSKYRSDPAWAAVLASALYSTINRGLEEVEDHHERAFLEGLLDLMA